MTIQSDSGHLILAHSRTLRLFTLFILYVGQGLPIGLTWFAIPAWMAARGASAEDVGTVLAMTALPWSLKLINGFLMDRYTYLPMGRRRVWLLGAQSVMMAVLLIGVFLNPDVKDVALLGLIGFCLNSATTFQDVAVDGLAVDIMEEDERARGSGMMFGGQSIGIACATALSGAVIGSWGLAAAYLIITGLVALLSFYIISFREREGERRLFWSPGSAHPRNLDLQVEAWWPILKTTFASITRMQSLLWLPVIFGKGVLFGGMTGATPLIGTQYLGWDEVQVSSLTAAAGIVAGILALSLGGWLGDRIGAKRSAILWLVLQLAMMGTMYNTHAHWGDQRLFLAFVYAWISLDLLLTVGALPISMRLCDPKVAATQFAIYMAISNFGISFGAFMLGRVGSMGGLPSIFVVAGMALVVSLSLLLTVKFPRRAGRVQTGTAPLD